MNVTGGCHCGSLTYHAEIDENRVVICHCSDCQKLSGSAFRTVAFTHEGKFKLTKGQIKTYVKIADSGAEREQGFCGECGTAIYASSTGDEPRVYGIRMGSLDEQQGLTPKLQVWSSSALRWTQQLEGIPEVKGQP